MMIFVCIKRILLLFTVFNIFGSCGLSEGALPFGIFPLLTSGWYYKPSPVESVVLGLIVVKVLALRLASITGILPIPYHLNDWFVRSLGKRSIDQYYDLGNLTMPQSPRIPKSPVLRNSSQSHFRDNDQLRKEADFTNQELEAMYRVLLGVRRIDTANCFLKTLCFISERLKAGKGSLEDRHLIKSMRYLIFTEKNVFKEAGLDRSPITDVFEKALLTGMRNTTSTDPCSSEYSSCPLTRTEMRYESIVAEVF